MEQAGDFAAEADLPADKAIAGGLGHPQLLWFDEIRSLFAQTGLPPEPDSYALFWLYVSGADAALTREMERLLDEGALTSEAIATLRRSHVGEIAASEVFALVESAQDQAARLADRLEVGRGELKGYDAVVADSDAALAVTQSVQELAALVQRLRRANATMMAANRRLEADISAAAMETGKLLDRLDTAERSARTDPLTGLLNRRGLMEALKRAQARAIEAGTPLSVSLVDIDHFKRVNDQWGHAIGDEVLRCIGSHLAAQAKKAAGEQCFAGRHGGEEFLVAMPGMALREASAAIDTARAILARQVMRRSNDGASLGKISFSAGVAMLRETDNVDSLIDRADAALYAAKRAGRDRVLPELPTH